MLPFHSCVLNDDHDDDEGDHSVNKLSAAGLPLFNCNLGLPVHYTAVCDGREDCVDGSDEKGCLAPQFAPLKDSSWQCGKFQLIPATRRCDAVPDCLDLSDEDFCSFCQVRNSERLRGKDIQLNTKDLFPKL